MKYCYKCGDTLPISEFTKDRSRVDGLKNKCKRCSKVLHDSWKEKNPSYYTEYSRYWSNKHPRRAAYQAQKARAKVRGIDFILSFEEWCEFWDGDFDARGRLAEDLCMARVGDSGPYAIGNVVKATVSDNCKRVV